jgi:serine/threonine-protein kinase
VADNPPSFDDRAQTLKAPASELPGPALDEVLAQPGYEPGRIIGRGGMGEVRHCKDPRLGRFIALKKATTTGTAELARFVREAQVLGQLEHPNIVPVHDLGLDSAGVPYFTMKRVYGDTLLKVLAQLSRGDLETSKSYPRRRLLQAFQAVCLAVDFAHKNGWLHRDLKPANVMLGAFGEVYVLDWGLARRIDEVEPSSSGALAPDSQPGLTNPGAVMGTPGYMSPQQVVGEPATVRSDVYALGALLFEILTHETLARGSTDRDLMVDTRAGCDARARRRAPHLDIPPELEAICIKATRRAPEERYATARELHAAVDRVLAGERDHALRASLAAHHTDAARQAIASAAQDLANELDHRKVALRELGLALSLVPGYPPAVVGMLGLVAMPTEHVPPEVAQELRAALVVKHRAAARGLFFIFLAFSVLGLAFGWSRVHHPWYLAALVGFGLAGAGVGALGGWGPLDPRRLLGPSMVMTSLAIMTVFFVDGPMLVVPVFACLNAAVYAMGVARRRRPLVIALGLVTALTPLLGSWWGLLPESFRYVKEGLLLVPIEDTYDPVATTFIVALSITAAIVTASLMVGAMADALHAAERRRVLQSWALKQMLAAEAVAAPATSQKG